MRHRAFRARRGGASAHSFLFLLAVSFLNTAFPGTAVRAEDDRLVGLMAPITASKPIRIAVTVVHLNDNFWRGVAYGIADEAKRSNVKVVRVSVAGGYGNTREQFAQLNTFKALGVDYIALGAASYDGYDPVIRQLKAAGVKVIAAGVPINSAEVAFGVTQDDGLIGRRLADSICGKSADARVVAIPGPAGAEWARLRFAAFMEEAKHCGHMSVFPGAFRGSVDLQQGLSQTADLLLKHPDANFVYTPSMSLGMGALQAVRQLGRTTPVVSSAMVPEAIPLLIEGRFLAVMSEPGIIMGRLIVQCAIRDSEGKPIPNQVRSSLSPYPYSLAPPTLVTAQNARTFPLGVYEIAPPEFNLASLQ